MDFIGKIIKATKQIVVVSGLPVHHAILFLEGTIHWHPRFHSWPLELSIHWTHLPSPPFPHGASQVIHSTCGTITFLPPRVTSTLPLSLMGHTMLLVSSSVCTVEFSCEVDSLIIKGDGVLADGDSTAWAGDAVVCK